MTEGVVHRLVGYDPVSERLAFEHDIPRDKLPLVKRIAHVDPTDAQAAGSYPLKDDEARDIAGASGFAMPPQDLQFFLEPFAAE